MFTFHHMKCFTEPHARQCRRRATLQFILADDNLGEFKLSSNFFKVYTYRTFDHPHHQPDAVTRARPRIAHKRDVR
jgi:hypothetical protein